MAELAIAAAVGGGTFAATGSIAAASFAFGATASLIGAYKASKAKGPSPSVGDAQVTSAGYGSPIPWIAGAVRVAGKMAWQSERRSNTTSAGGGKGGGPRQTSTTYERDVLFRLSINEAEALARVWLNGKLIWTALDSADPDSLAASNDTDLWRRITFYSGAEDQLPDPIYEAAVGVGNAPAYRGGVTVFIEALQLGNSGQLPNLTFEVITKAAQSTFLYKKDISQNDATIERISGPNDLAELTIAKFGQSAPIGTSGQHFQALANTPSQFVGLTDCTAECWFYRTSTNTSETLLCVMTGASDAGEGWELNVIGGRLQGRVWRGNSVAVANGTIDMPSSEWVHVRMRMVGSQLSVYQNGILAASNPSALVPNPQPGRPLIIGSGTRFGATAGFIDEVRISSVDRGTGVPTERFTVDDDTVFLWRCDAPSIVAPGNVTLREVVEALCARAGMPAGSYDASALDAITKPVRSLTVAEVGATRAVLEQLQAAYFFDATVSDKLYFRPRPASSLLTIPYEDLGAGAESAAEEPFELKQASDIELPAKIALQYINVNDDYQSGVENSDRLTTRQVANEVADLAIGMTPSEAKAVANAMGADEIAALTTGSISVGMKYARLEPGDVVQIRLPSGALSPTMRLGRKSDADGVIGFEVRRYDAQATVGAGLTDGNYTPSAVVVRASATLLQPLDIPLLRDSDDGPGWYAAAKPAGSVWPSGQVFSSVNDVDFTSVATISERAVFGTTVTALPNFTGGWVMDEVSRVTVDMGLGELSSTTRDGLFADETVNPILIGNEFTRYVVATLVSSTPTNNRYELSRFLRGRKGTEWAMSTHAIGERVVLLRPQGLRRVVQQQSDIGALRYVKAVTNGQTLSSAESVEFTNTGQSQHPLSPADVRVSRDATGNFSLAWARRSRLSSVFLSPLGLPLGEASEAYSIDVVDVASGAVRAMLTASTPAVSMSIAQQAAAGIASGDALRFDVHQVSATVGRGRPASALGTASYVTRPQVTEFALTGSFTAGLELSVQLSRAATVDTVSYTTVSGDATLAGAATSFAAAINALPAYSASATGAVIRVTGPDSVDFNAQPLNDFAGFIALETTQFASPAVAVDVAETYELGWESALGYSAADVHQTRVQRLSDSSVIDASLSMPPGAITAEGIAGAMAAVINSSTAFQALGIWATGISGRPKSIVLSIPAALGGRYSVSRLSTNAGIANLVIAATTTAQLAGPARPQISAATVPAVTAGNSYLLAINLTQTAVVVASGGDTATSVAASLASQIDALADFTATSSGAVVTVTHVSNNAPFTLGQAVVTGSIIIGFPTLIQAAQ